MKLIVFMLLFILPLYTTETSTDLAQYAASASFSCHPSAQTLGSSKIQAHYATFSVKLPESWIPVSATYITGRDFEVTESNVGNLTRDRRLLFISSTIKSSFFATGIEQGLAPNTVVKLINIYKDFGIDFKKDIVPKSKLEVLFERLPNNQKTEEKVLYASLTINKKAISLYHYKSQDGKERYFNNEGISLKNGEIFANPLNGDYRVSSKFGNRKHPVRGKTAFHKGVDYAAKLGTPIYAAAEGVVEYIGKNGGYGNYIKIKHKNEYSTCYAHISRFSGDIKLGSKVKQGQVIAYVGSTGVATGPHLHYEVIYNGKHIDPLTIAHKTEVKLPDHELREFKLFVNKINKTINREDSSEKEV
ncbi:M23 family metallopeptidase [Wolbachia endosymbiont of Oedothorax gibbosus]|uniref:M23 family metallopeptidase n=1 Tax=Wolbachia endosymbiont of Oedothorax gibbosus TaxID=931100 RepID=UPI002024AA04|nr:M23 family metallopeptidase [Wolbachia endosymbiont of Oedothorax gibbosus]